MTISPWRFLPVLPCLAVLLAGLPAGLRAEGVTAVAPPAMYPATSWQGRGSAVLRIMRRLDSRVELVTIRAGESVPYGPLSLRLERCLQKPEGLPARSAAQLHIEDTQDTGSPAFDGWMFTDDPALGAYAGALYDVQVTGCEGQKVEPMLPPLSRPAPPQLPPLMAPHVEADEEHGTAAPPAPAPSAPGGNAEGQGSAGGAGPLSLLPPAAPAPPQQEGGTPPPSR